MPIYKLGGDAPAIHESAFVANNATIIGKVSLARQASVWFNATLRGDNDPITIGEGCNIQDGAILHTDLGYPLTLQKNVSVGHQAMLHGCTVGEGSMIGIQAVVLNGAVIGHHCLVGAGAIVTGGKVFPDRSLILGSPARVVRELTEEDLSLLAHTVDNYIARRERFRTQLVRIG